MTEKSPFLRTEGLSFTYEKNKPVLKNISFTLKDNNFAAVIGPNGSGKTTLIKLLAGILKADAGEVAILGRPVDYKTDVSEILAYVPQSLTVDFGIQVLDFVLLGRSFRADFFGGPKTRDIEKAMESLSVLHMADHADSDLSKLSGGERQKIFLAKALVQDAPVLLLDEPITHLDLNNQIEILTILKKLSLSGGKKIIAIMHDINLAYRYADYTVMLKKGSLFAAGETSETITEKSIEGCFAVKVEKTKDFFWPPGNDPL